MRPFYAGIITAPVLSLFTAQVSGGGEAVVIFVPTGSRRLRITRNSGSVPSPIGRRLRDKAAWLMPLRAAKPRLQGNGSRLQYIFTYQP
ncbi:hypothetical protein KCP73_01860 [Salmonella enterica subsp. enterica]|nr:hypothetical protein KCP73_01860 [Salmonella enterica subsp. enterica]